MSAPTSSLVRPLRTSESGTYRQCLLKWYLTYQLGFLSHRINPNFWLGTLVHFVLSEWYQKRTTDPAHLFQEIADYLIDMEQVDAPTISGVELELDNVIELRECRNMGIAMLEGFQDWAKRNFSDFDVIASELAYFVPMETLDGDDFTYVARMDLVIENSEGIRVPDFKTAKDFRGEKTVEYDQQFRRYPYLVAISHPDWAKDVRGAEWVALRKIIPSARSKPPYFTRMTIDLQKGEWKTVEQELLAEATAIMRLEQQLAEGVDPRTVIFPNPTFDCSWKCIFYTNGLCMAWRNGVNFDDPEIGMAQGTWGNDMYTEYRTDYDGSVPVTIGRIEDR